MAFEIDHGKFLSFVAQGTNSGKTTILQGVIAELKRRGRRVCALKHGMHMHYHDPAGKDTERFASSGADRVAMFSPEGLLVYENVTPSLEYLMLAASHGVDVVLVEGYKSGPFRKIEVFNDTLYERPLCVEHPSPDYIALVCNRAIPLDIPTFLFGQIEEITTFVEESVGLGRHPASNP